MSGHLDALAGANLASFAQRVELPVLVITHQLFHKQSAGLAELLPGCSFVSTEPFYFNGPAGRWLREEIDRFRSKFCGVNSNAATGSTTSDLFRVAVLSRRERDILRRLAAGHSNADIAAELTLSVRTVERHVANIYSKLGVHNRVEAANWAMRNGLL